MPKDTPKTVLNTPMPKATEAKHCDRCGKLTMNDYYKDTSETLCVSCTLNTDKPMPVDATTGAQREKLNTTPYDLFPFEEIVPAYCEVAEHGAKKYEPWNWTKGLSTSQLLGSLCRHTWSRLRGRIYDKDSGIRHSHHILWNAAALVHNEHHELLDDIRAEPERDYHLDKFHNPVAAFKSQDKPTPTRSPSSRRDKCVTWDTLRMEFPPFNYVRRANKQSSSSEVEIYDKDNKLVAKTTSGMVNGALKYSLYNLEMISD